MLSGCLEAGSHGSMEQLVVPEPEWILHTTEAGTPLFWRRDGSEDNPRVKFKYEVEIKEFCRGPHEMEDPALSADKDLMVTTTVSIAMTCLMCLAVMILPWYIMIK